MDRLPASSSHETVDLTMGSSSTSAAGLNGMISLEQHGARRRHGLYARVGQRLLAMATCIWHNTNIGAPRKRSLIAYDH